MSETPEPRRLSAVPSDPPGAPAAAPRPTRPRRVVLLLSLALAICAVLLASQIQRASQLQATVSGLEAELATTRASLARYEERMGEIRSQVGDLSERMEALEALVAEDAPPAPAAEQGEPQAP